MEGNFENTRTESYDIAMQLQTSIQSLFTELMAFLPELVAAIVIIVLGFFIGGILGSAVRKLFKHTKLDKALDKAGVDDVGFINQLIEKLNPMRIIILKWSFLLLFCFGIFSITFLGNLATVNPRISFFTSSPGIAQEKETLPGHIINGMTAIGTDEDPESINIPKG